MAGGWWALLCSCIVTIQPFMGPLRHRGSCYHGCLGSDLCSVWWEESEPQPTSAASEKLHTGSCVYHQIRQVCFHLPGDRWCRRKQQRRRRGPRSPTMWGLFHVFVLVSTQEDRKNGIRGKWECFTWRYPSQNDTLVKNSTNSYSLDPGCFPSVEF